MNNEIFRGIDHIGLTVPNIEDATIFFKNALNANVLYDVLPKDDKPMEGKETETQLGIPKNSKIVHMRLLEIGNGPTIEMFQFSNTPQKDTANLNDFGWQHIALYTDDIEKATEQVKLAGGKLLSEPHPLANVENEPRNRGVYFKSPWGSLIELISYPDGLKDKKLHRWTPKK